MMRAKNVLESFKYAYQGIVYALKTQRNMRIHISAFIVIILVSIFFKITAIEFAVLLLVGTIVVIAEMINTAIESAIDLYSRERHPLAKIGKDVAAGAVLMSSFSSVAIGVIILGPYLLNFLRKNFNIPF